LPATRRDGTCSQCGSHIPVGSKAWWGQTLTCTHCRPVIANQTAQPARTQPVVSQTGSPWSTYIRYLIQCVEHESVINSKDLEAHNVWVPCRQSTERTLIECHSFPATAVRSDRETLLYGWPTIAMTTKGGRLVRLPLLVLTIRRSKRSIRCRRSSTMVPPRFRLTWTNSMQAPFIHRTVQTNRARKRT
jgi:hypothetical protein